MYWIKFILIYYLAAFTYSGLIIAMQITLDSKASDLIPDCKFGNFIYHIFILQFAVYCSLYERINKAGIIIIEILITVIFLPMNIMLFVAYMFYLIVDGIRICFYKIFRKRNEESETSD